MLLLCGDITVKESWHVEEPVAPLYARVYYVDEGEVTYCAEGSETILKPGCLYCFPTIRPYVLRQNPAHPLRCLYLHIDLTPGMLSALLELHVEPDSFLAQLIASMRSWLSLHQPLPTDTVMDALSDALLAYLRTEQLLQTIPNALYSALAYIPAHLELELPIELLSELCGYHPQYFIRLFRRHMDMTPHQYIIRFRMRFALHYLQAGLSVTETAAKVGYPEARNFCRSFRSYYGIAPTQFMTII